MASDTEDLELESLRFAVLASLKPKPPQNDVTKSGASSDSPAGTGEDPDEEDLRLLRLAALKSKKEDSTSHVSTPVAGSPTHPPYHAPQVITPQLQPAPFLQTAPSNPNLITIPLQDTSAPIQPAPPAGKADAEDDGAKEERSTKFRRFESSDSESSDSDEEILLKSASNSERSAFSATGSEKEDEDSDADSWRTRSFSEAESSDAEAENDPKFLEDASNKNSDGRERAEKDAKGQNEIVSDKSRHPERKDKKSERVIRNDNARENRDSDRRNRRDRDEERHSDLRSRLGNKDRRGDRNHRDTKGKRDDYRSRDSEHEKRIEERRRQYETRRGEKRHSPERSQRHTADWSKRPDRTLDSVDKRAFEARRQKFASGSSVTLKDKKVTLKTVRSSENGADIPVSKNSARDSDSDKRDTQNEKQKVEAEKLPTEPIESDISLSSVESEAESESESEAESEDKKESESESDSGSDDEEVTRFKHTSTKRDAKTSLQAPTQSRLITSMTFPKEGPPALLPRRRPNDNGRGRDRRGLDDLERPRRPLGFHEQRRERIRQDHLSRLLDQQERSSSRESRDRLRLDSRDSHRHPRDANVNDKLGDKDHDKLRKPRNNDLNERERDIKKNPRDTDNNERGARTEHAPRRNPRDSNINEKRSRAVARDDEKTVNERVDHTERGPRRTPRDPNLEEKTDRIVPRDDKRTLSIKIKPSAKDFVSESSDSESETTNQALRSIVKTDKPEEDTKSDVRDSERLQRSKYVNRDEPRPKKDSKRDRGTKEKKSKHKRDVKERIGRRKRDVVEREKISDDEAAKVDSFRVTVSEDPAAQKKRSVLDRLGSAPSSDKARNSVKSRLGPVKMEAADSTTDIITPRSEPNDEFLPDENLGPHGDGVKRRKVEINDAQSNPTKKRLKLKRVEIKYDEMEVDSVSDMYTVAEPPVKRKQLSKSLLSRLSDKPSSTLLDSEDTSTPLSRVSSPEMEPVVKRKVKSRDADERISKKSKSKSKDVWSSRRKAETSEPEEDVDGMLSKRDVRKSKNKDIWTSKRSIITADPERDDDELQPGKKERRSRDVWSSTRKAVSMETGNDCKGSKDDELEERIKKIKAKNAAIIQRQREIEQEKKMFSGRS